MKKLAAAFILIICTISCNHRNKGESISQYSDSIIEIEKRNQEIQDSLNEARIDSLSSIAWGTAKFGMSIKEVLATEAFKKGRKGSYKNYTTVSMDFDNKWKLKEVFNLYLTPSEFDAYFLEDELTKIQIESSKLSATELNGLIADCDIFIKNFTDKYGSPSYELRKVNIAFVSGEEFTYTRFRIGSKSITIKLGKMRSEHKYYYVIIIDNNKFPIKKHVPTEEEIKEEQRRIEEAKRIKENSF